MAQQNVRLLTRDWDTLMSATIISVECRLKKLEDIEEIRRVRMQYHYFINEGLFADMASLFTDHASVDFGGIGRAKGREGIRDFFLSVPRNLSLIKQFIHNHIVDVDGDRATGLAYMDARYAQGGNSVIAAARFTETYCRISNIWKIETMSVQAFFSVPLTEGWAGEKLNSTKPFDQPHEEV